MSHHSRLLILVVTFLVCGTHAWAEDRRLIAYSTTAMAITGDITLGEDAITFGNGVRVGLTPAGTRSGTAWRQVTGADGTVRLYAMDADPGALLNGNTLCGGIGAAGYLAVQEFGTDGRELSLSAFAGGDPPRTVSDRLCGTFNFGKE